MPLHRALTLLLREFGRLGAVAELRGEGLVLLTHPSELRLQLLLLHLELCPHLLLSLRHCFRDPPLHLLPPPLGLLRGAAAPRLGGGALLLLLPLLPAPHSLLQHFGRRLLIVRRKNPFVFNEIPKVLPLLNHHDGHHLHRVLLDCAIGGVVGAGGIGGVALAPHALAALDLLQRRRRRLGAAARGRDATAGGAPLLLRKRGGGGGVDVADARARAEVNGAHDGLGRLLLGPRSRERVELRRRLPVRLGEAAQQLVGPVATVGRRRGRRLAPALAQRLVLEGAAHHELAEERTDGAEAQRLVLPLVPRRAQLRDCRDFDARLELLRAEVGRGEVSDELANARLQARDVGERALLGRDEDGLHRHAAAQHRRRERLVHRHARLWFCVDERADLQREVAAANALCPRRGDRDHRDGVALRAAELRRQPRTLHAVQPRLLRQNRVQLVEPAHFQLQVEHIA